MEQKDLNFVIENDIKEASYYCGDDACFVAKFVTYDGDTFEFKMSREKVMEHIEKTSKHPEVYMTNKKLVVEHFHTMARRWFLMTRTPVNVETEDFEETKS